MEKEIPILFNGEMVRAILAGRKTQTRRPVKAHKSMLEEWEVESVNDAYDVGMSCNKDGAWFLFAGDQGYDFIKSPFGKPGDVLWIRESMYRLYHGDSEYGWKATDQIEYMADGNVKPTTNLHMKEWRSVPSIHMPKDACRIRLKVKRVWVERVQRIRGGEAHKEGVKNRSEFRELWNSIYGTWERNDWVWCCEFEKQEEM